MGLYQFVLMGAAVALALMQADVHATPDTPLMMGSEPEPEPVDEPEAAILYPPSIAYEYDDYNQRPSWFWGGRQQLQLLTPGDNLRSELLGRADVGPAVELVCSCRPRTSPLRSPLRSPYVEVRRAPRRPTPIVRSREAIRPGRPDGGATSGPGPRPPPKASQPRRDPPVGSISDKLRQGDSANKL